jgi:hypothetical protein
LPPDSLLSIIDAKGPLWRAFLLQLLVHLSQYNLHRIKSVLRRDSVLIFGNPQVLSNIHIEQQVRYKSQ